MSSLLDPAFLGRLAQLAIRARRRFAGAAAGARRSTRRGSSAEFADHRPYYPGDDVRRIDWNAYARLEELVLRLFVAEEDLSLHLLLDASASLSTGSPPKIETAKKIAAALGYVALTSSDRVSVWPFTTSVATPMPPSRGRKRIATLLRYLERVEAGGRTDLSRAVEALLARRPKPGLVAVLSDFLDPAGFVRPLDRLIADKHEPVLFHVVDREEMSPAIGGDFVLVDAERGREVEVSLDERAVRAYRARLKAFCDELEDYARKRGLFYGRIESADAFEDVLLRYLRAA